MAEDTDWIAILILKPLKNPKTPSSRKMVPAVSTIVRYFIYTDFYVKMCILTKESLFFKDPKAIFFLLRI